MKRTWKSCVAPKKLHDTIGIFHGSWMPQMDRAWRSNDGFLVMSRLLHTAAGEVEHAIIMRTSHGKFISSDGSSDISWAEKQTIKDEVFGCERTAIEIFPSRAKLINVLDIYHLWIFPIDYSFPFGIHPTQEKMCSSIPRASLPPSKR